jgi:hypothetical protein
MAQTPTAASEATETKEVETLKAVSINTGELRYNIPLKFRKMENLHIVFWLFKDLSWCLSLKWLAGIMIIPTLVISFIIAWNTRHFVSELCHNLAITIWIMANSYWMITEFLHIDDTLVFGTVTYKSLAIIPFVIGILILGYYYIYWKPRNAKEGI